MTGWSLPDARYFQIAALGSLLAINFSLIDFGARPLPSAVAIGAALLTQIACSRIAGLPKLDLRSPMITGLSLSLLLRADALWLYAAAAVIAIGSKFLLRVDGKHIWNPAGLAIVVLLLTSSGVWISPGQWGTEVWFAALTGFLAILVLGAARRADIAIFARMVARRSPRHSIASAAERLIADLHVLHDFRPANLAGFGARPLPVCLRRRVARALHGVFHADAAGAVFRADYPFPCHHGHRLADP